MTEERRAEIRQIVDHFRSLAPYMGGKAPTQEEIDAYCKQAREELFTTHLKAGLSKDQAIAKVSGKLEPFSPGFYEDYLVQIEHDELIVKTFKEVLAEVQNLQYIPELAPAEVREAGRKNNEEVRIKVAQIFEENAIRYRLVDTLGKELASIIGQTIEMAGTSVFNKAIGVLLHIAKEKFEGEFNVKHARDYAIKIYGDAGNLEPKQ